ncbi:MAG TPA: S28 family serine protease, partial [Polyangiaceae bacterium]|nr:S28 family serine protease [Polyangiaceae bacterium]
GGAGLGGVGGVGGIGGAGQGGVGGVGGIGGAGQGGVGGIGGAGQGGIGGAGQGGTGGTGGAPPDFCDATTKQLMLQQLSALPDLSKVTTGATTVSGACAFTFEIDQPVDHQNPAGPHFKQRVRLMHRSTAKPTSLSTNGYSIGGGSFIGNDELSFLLQGNRIHVEHRYFPPSQPANPDWQYLTIEQSAADHHHLVQVIRPLYTGKWVSTGASKGGMTASYHHRFYPGDVDGTVAYVAPRSNSPADPRYTDFLDQVGTAACRERIIDLQREALGPRREAFVARMVSEGAASGSTFDHFGPDRLFEFAIIESRFVFWQYGDVSQCNSLPLPTASDNAIYDFFDSVANFSGSYDDAILNYYAPYYYQASVQLGGPESTERHLEDLLRYPGQNVPSAYPPVGVSKPFDPDAMVDIADWALTEAQHVVFVYGQNDPWSAAAYEIGAGADTYRLFAPNGNHGSGIFELTEPDQTVALNALEAWTGVTPLRQSPSAEEHSAFRRERRENRPPMLP